MASITFSPHQAPFKKATQNPRGPRGVHLPPQTHVYTQDPQHSI